MATVLSVYLYMLPIALYTAWVGIALWELMARDDVGTGASIGWMAFILLIPLIGIIAYYVFGKSEIPAWQRLTLIGGGLLAYAILFAIGSLIGGVV